MLSVFRHSLSLQRLSFLGDRVNGFGHELLSVVCGALLFRLESSSEVTVRSGVAFSVEVFQFVL
jgi:hypothetical protein